MEIKDIINSPIAMDEIIEFGNSLHFADIKIHITISEKDMPTIEHIEHVTNQYGVTGSYIEKLITYYMIKNECIFDSCYVSRDNQKVLHLSNML